MAAGEVACLVAVGVLIGVAVGAALALHLASRSSQTVARRTDLADRHTRWLAARLTVSRASLSFVAAFRALAAERGDSIHLTLRTEEAQRARAHWCDAMREVDLAQAAMIAHGEIDPQLEARFESPPVSGALLRQAINGDEREVARLVKRLGEADRASVDLVRSIAARRDSLGWQDRCRRRVSQSIALAESIINRWSRPD